MTELVDPDAIEAIVGAKRHATRHIARAVSADEEVYILHSKRCKESLSDLRDCRYSRALDCGIDLGAWGKTQDEPVVVIVGSDGDLLPAFRLPKDQP